MYNFFNKRTRTWNIWFSLSLVAYDRCLAISYMSIFWQRTCFFGRYVDLNFLDHLLVQNLRLSFYIFSEFQMLRVAFLNDLISVNLLLNLALDRRCIGLKMIVLSWTTALKKISFVGLSHMICRVIHCRISNFSLLLFYSTMRMAANEFESLAKSTVYEKN